MVVLCAYDLTRGAADSLGIGVHVHPMIDFDRFVFFGETPTEWLQAHLYDPGSSTGGTSPSRSSTPPTSSSPSRSPASSGCATGSPSCASPGAWSRSPLAGARHLHRLPGGAALDGGAKWACSTESTGPPRKAGRCSAVGTAGLFSKGQASVNLVAAVPSLHSAFTALVAMFLWGRVRPRLRPLLALYPLAMGLTLIATGEHYFFDVLLGWLYAGAVMAAWAWWERRRAQQAQAVPATAVAETA